MPRLLLTLFALLFLPAPASALPEDVPFVVTPDNVTLEMLKLANVGPKDYVIDLGSGDGRIVIVAAKRFRARGLGVEIVPDLVKKSRENATAAGVADKVEFREEDLYKTDMSQATVVTMYLLPEVNLQLRPKILALAPGTRIVSHDWDMGDWKPDMSNTVIAPEKIVGRDKWSVVHLWIVPARIGGTWCRVGKAGQLDLRQEFQKIAGVYSAGGAKQEVEGRMEGARMITSEVELELKGDALRVAHADKPFAGIRGATFRPAAGGRC